MRVIAHENFDYIYKEALALLLSSLTTHVTSTKGENYEMRNILVELTNIENNRIDFTSTLYPNRQKSYDRYLSKELEWYLEGCRDELNYKNSPAPKVWKRYADQKGKIVSNYGHMILRKVQTFGNKKSKRKRDTSFNRCLNLLKENPFTRNAVMHYNLPEHIYDGAKDIPCTMSAQVFIRENKLHMTVFQRSSDIYTGLPYDVPWHCELMKKFIFELNGKKRKDKLTAGTLALFIGSMHLYTSDFQKATQIGRRMGIAV